MPSLYTLSYNKKAANGAGGWASFYSYRPEWMLGMNQYFYTFQDGNLWRHNTNPLRNTFYGAASAASTLTGVFNDMPLQNKLYKTLNLESNDAWAATMVTDIQATGAIEESWFVKKEQSWFGFVRNDGPVGSFTDETQWELRSMNGIGNSISVGGTAAAYNITFDIPIGSIISVGDFLYYAVAPNYDTPVFAGEVTNVSATVITIDSTTQAGTTNPIPAADTFIMYIKDPIAESHGVLGHYCTYTLSLNTTSATELFAVQTEAMKSYP